MKCVRRGSCSNKTDDLERTSTLLFRDLNWSQVLSSARFFELKVDSWPSMFSNFSARRIEYENGKIPIYDNNDNVTKTVELDASVKREIERITIANTRNAQPLSSSECSIQGGKRIYL